MRTHHTHHWTGKSSWGELPEGRNHAFTNLGKPALRSYPANNNHSKHLFLNNWRNCDLMILTETSAIIDLILGTSLQQRDCKAPSPLLVVSPPKSAPQLLLKVSTKGPGFTLSATAWFQSPSCQGTWWTLFQ